MAHYLESCDDIMHGFRWNELHHVDFWLASTIVVRSVDYFEGTRVQSNLIILKEPINLYEFKVNTCEKRYFKSYHEVYENNGIGSIIARNNHVFASKAKGECPYCGGILQKGVFGVKCSKCGKK